jgi:hypothetical protein
VSRTGGIGKLLILADGGGANGARKNAWKCELQAKVCDLHGLAVTVCHYPPGASKWNPIEHRLFSEISKNWAGKLLDSHETMLKYIRTTKTSTGLRVRATLSKRNYQTRVTPAPDQVASLNLRRHHRFRDTLKTRLSEHGVDGRVSEHILGHVVPGIAGVYDHSELFPQRKEALAWWDSELDRILQPKAASPGYDPVRQEGV